MKSRAEVMAEKKAAEAKKASAEERTIPLPAVGMVAKCDACDAVTPADKCSMRSDGFAECPECGAPVRLTKPEAETSTRVDAKEELPKFEVKHPERKWCGECGTELSFTNRGIFFPCGHQRAERIDDPRKATKVAPPGGLQTRTYHEIDKRNAADAAASKKGSDMPKPTEATIKLEGNRLSIQWGESRHPIGEGYNYFKTGGFIVTVDLPPDGNRVAAAREIMNELEEIAELAFQRQRAWYLKKLGVSD